MFDYRMVVKTTIMAHHSSNQSSPIQPRRVDLPSNPKPSSPSSSSWNQLWHSCGPQPKEMKLHPQLMFNVSFQNGWNSSGHGQRTCINEACPNSWLWQQLTLFQVCSVVCVQIYLLSLWLTVSVPPVCQLVKLHKHQEERCWKQGARCCGLLDRGLWSTAQVQRRLFASGRLPTGAGQPSCAPAATYIYVPVEGTAKHTSGECFSGGWLVGTCWDVDRQPWDKLLEV